MSALRPHIRAAHALGDAFEGQAGHSSDPDRALLLMSIATAYRVAATTLQAEQAAEYAQPVAKASTEYPVQREGC